MRILLTLDLWKPPCPEAADAHWLVQHIAGQIRIADFQLDVIAPPPEEREERTLADWLEKASSREMAARYDELTQGSLGDYDLIIGIDLPPRAERLFCALGARCLVVRSLPYEGCAGFVLCRQNFRFPDEWSRTLPPVKNLLPSDAGIPHPGALLAGTSPFNSDRIAGGSLTNLASFQDEIISMLATHSRYYYVASAPFDPSEIRAMRAIGCSLSSTSLVTQLASPKIEAVFALDSRIAALAAAYSKPFRQFGTPQRWNPVPLRFFRDRDFLVSMASQTLCRDGEKTETAMGAMQTV